MGERVAQQGAGVLAGRKVDPSEDQERRPRPLYEPARRQPFFIVTVLLMHYALHLLDGLGR
jgi:hypothetical protein